MTASCDSNRTLRILNNASKGKYGVLAIVVYNVEQLTALTRASEAKQSPLIILLFPSTVAQLPTLPFAAAAAVRSATVPLALHLDHAQDTDQIWTVADSMPFDSIMVDMSHYDQAENFSMTKMLAAACHSKGIAVEGKSGRINGGEEGIADTGHLEGSIHQCNATQIIGWVTDLQSRWSRDEAGTDIV